MSVVGICKIFRLAAPLIFKLNMLGVHGQQSEVAVILMWSGFGVTIAY